MSEFPRKAVWKKLRMASMVPPPHVDRKYNSVMIDLIGRQYHNIIIRSTKIKGKNEAGTLTADCFLFSQREIHSHFIEKGHSFSLDFFVPIP